MLHTLFYSYAHIYLLYVVTGYIYIFVVGDAVQPYTYESDNVLTARKRHYPLAKSVHQWVHNE